MLGYGSGSMAFKFVPLSYMGSEVKCETNKLREKKGKEKGRIEGTVDTLRELGYGEPEIKNVIMQRYGLSVKEAEEYLYGEAGKTC